MNNKPTISIIIPTHNSEKYISRIKDCLFAQSFSDFEALFIVSGDDDTAAILQEVAVGDPRIRIIEDSNSSYGHKINVGIKAAQGEYISILESDDEYSPDFLEQLKAAIESEPGKTLDFVKGNFAMFADLPQGRKCLEMSLASIEACGPIIDLQQEPQYRRNLYTHIWTGLYRKEFLTENNIKCNESPGASFQDAGFSILCALYGRKIKFAPKAIYLYRMDNVKSSSKDDSKYLCIRDEFDWVKSELIARKLNAPDAMDYYNSCMHSSFFWNAKRLHPTPRQKFLEAIDDGIVDILDLENAIASAKEIEKLVQFLTGEKKCVLWGAAGIGRDVLVVQDFLEKNAITKVVDNNPELIGKAVGDYIIEKPGTDIINRDYFFILTGKRSTPEIKKQLMDEGVEEANIIEIKEPVNREDLMLSPGRSL